MTIQAGTPVIRRSALEARHVALGATFIADAVRWPLDYSDPAAEARAVADGAGLAELGPFEELLLRGPDVAVALAPITDPSWPARDGPGVRPLILGTGRGEAWLLAPDEACLLRPVGGAWPIDLTGGPGAAAASSLSAIELTGARTVLRLAGPAAPAIMAELCPVDTTPAALPDGGLIQASVAAVRAIVARRDRGSVPGYTMLVARDLATYVWDVALEIGTRHGLVPVGPAAVATTDPLAAR